MKKSTKKNAWVVELSADVASKSKKRITIPREALNEAGWNLDNCFYTVKRLDNYGWVELTQDGRRKDIDKTYTIFKCNGYPVVQVNFNPFKKLRDAKIYRAVVEVDPEEGVIYATPLIYNV